MALEALLIPNCSSHSHLWDVSNLILISQHQNSLHLYTGRKIYGTWKRSFPSCYKKPELFSFIVRLNTMVNSKIASDLSHFFQCISWALEQAQGYSRVSPQTNKPASLMGCKNFLELLCLWDLMKLASYFWSLPAFVIKSLWLSTSQILELMEIPSHPTLPYSQPHLCDQQEESSTLSSVTPCVYFS